MNRSEILKTAQKLISGDRADTHGSAKDAFQLAGRLYEGWRLAGGDRYSPAHNTAIMLAFVKLSRIAMGKKGHEDNYVDLVGYVALAGEMADKDVEI